MFHATTATGATAGEGQRALLRAIVLAASLAATATHAAATRHPAVRLHAAADIPALCDAGLARARQAVAGIETLPLARAGVKTVFHALNAMQIGVEDVEGTIYLLSNVSPDKAVREAAEACLLKYSEFGTDWLQSEKLYRRVLAVKATTAVDRKLKKDLKDGFEDTGVALSPEKRARMKDIIQKLEEARQEFERNVRDNKTRMTFSPDEMRGLPAAYLEKAKRDDKGNYVLGFEYPEYFPFMTNADDEDARRRYQFEFTNRGGARNIAVLGQVADLRREMAGLFGMQSYAQFSLRRKMAGKPQAVRDFLDDVKAQVRAVAAQDVEELRVLKAQRLGKPLAEVKINNWDGGYYRDKLRKARYDIDREALREYFPTGAAIAWMMHVSGELYGIEFRRAAVAAWHPEVEYFDVFDGGSGRFLAGLYLDLFPREGKFGHAASFGVRAASSLAGRTPIAVLVANLDRKGLDNTELETLVHEFGHALHHIFARTAYVAHGGSGLEWDFVEAPSQMYEEWARRSESLRLLSRFCTGCKQVDDDLVRRLESARRLGMGTRYVDQHLLADYDFTLYGETPVDPLQTWVKMESDTVLGHTPGTLFPSSFEHIVRGYAAGYYGYMWSEVLALDMLSPFGANIMNPKAGKRFRDTVLAHGGDRPAAQLVEKFLGRKPSNAAFIAEITGKRKSN
ncbi:MAG: Zn-dependent oligopeptidase [Betaproteobacteria bacterium]|nr:Zn-dependent oligopeptidase [Betaproteobacteria bacterium]